MTERKPATGKLQVKCCHGNTVEECDGTCTDNTRCTPPKPAPAPKQEQDLAREAAAQICDWLQSDDDPITEGERRKCYDIINAALAAEREKYQALRTVHEVFCVGVRKALKITSPIPISDILDVATAMASQVQQLRSQISETRVTDGLGSHAKVVKK